MDAKKTLIVVIAVAILGGGGIYSKGHKTTDAQTGSSTTSTAVKSADTATASPPTSSSSNTSGYKDGTYNGTAEDTAYGIVQVQAIISGGKIVDVKFLEMPDSEGHSQEVTAEAKAPLRASAIAKQSAHVDFVSGATQTSEGYELSLQAALDQAA